MTVGVPERDVSIAFPGLPHSAFLRQADFRSLSAEALNTDSAGNKITGCEQQDKLPSFSVPCSRLFTTVIATCLIGQRAPLLTQFRQEQSLKLIDHILVSVTMVTTAPGSHWSLCR